MRKTAIINTQRKETIMVVSVDRVTLRKYKYDNTDYQPLLNSVDAAIPVDRTYHGLVRGNRIKLIPITGKNSITFYFDGQMRISDYFYKGKVHFVKENTSEN